MQYKPCDSWDSQQRAIIKCTPPPKKKRRQRNEESTVRPLDTCSPVWDRRTAPTILWRHLLLPQECENVRRRFDHASHCCRSKRLTNFGWRSLIVYKPYSRGDCQSETIYLFFFKSFVLHLNIWSFPTGADTFEGKFIAGICTLHYICSTHVFLLRYKTFLTIVSLQPIVD